MRRSLVPLRLRETLSAGLRVALPVIPVMAVFGVAFGAAALRSLTLAEAVFMSAVVFAGASQFVAIEIWSNPLSVGGVLTLALVTATVNMRFVLMSASLRPWLGPLSNSKTYLALAVMTDPGWFAIMRYFGERGRNAHAFLVSGIVLWLTWIAGTALGYYLGELITDPARFGLDLVTPVFFAVMLVPLWRGSLRAIPWVIAGAIALVTAELLPGWWFIIGGAMGGTVAGVFVHERS